MHSSVLRSLQQRRNVSQLFDNSHQTLVVSNLRVKETDFAFGVLDSTSKFFACLRLLHNLVGGCLGASEVVLEFSSLGNPSVHVGSRVARYCSNFILQTSISLRLPVFCFNLPWCSPLRSPEPLAAGAMLSREPVLKPHLRIAEMFHARPTGELHLPAAAQRLSRPLFHRASTMSRQQERVCGSSLYLCCAALRWP